MRPGGFGMALLAAVGLCAATPPAWFPGGECLLLPGLMALYALATAARWPLLWAYLVGLAHMLWFSWSLRHVNPPGYLAVGVLGGCYYVLLCWLCRRLWRWPGPLAFGLATAAAFWLRAVMPEIAYPHGQPCHAFWQQPWLLGAVRWGGEPLANALLGGLAAALVEALRSWRVAVPRLAGAAVSVAVPALLLFALAAIPPPGPPALAAGASAGLRVAAIEPGFGPQFQYGPDYARLFVERLLRPTVAVAGPGVPDERAPDLVLWPESTHPGLVTPAATPSGLQWTTAGLEPVRLHPRTRLLVGADRRQEIDAASTPAAVLLDHRGRFQGHQEKQRLVPGGEFVPFASWLGDAWRTWLEEQVRERMGAVPRAVAGGSLPPLRTADGIPFGTLHCYDNAFPGPALDQVRQGARLLCVLSNEAWYHGGGELDQLAAMTVIRALETGTPLVRCTVDGATLAVDGQGRVLDRLPWLPLPRSEARTMTVFVPLGAGALGPMAWLLPVLPVTILGLIGLGLLHAAVAWAKLRAVRPNRTDAPGSVPGFRTRSGGS